MPKSTLVKYLTIIFAIFFITGSAYSQEMNKFFFLHHSTGNGIIVQGNMRAYFNSYNTNHSTNYLFWDHGYNSDGLRDSAGDFTGTNYNIPDDNTNPDGLNYLWTVPNSARDSIMANYEVIAFKSCFPASAIPDTETLNQYKTWYLEMRDFFDAHTEKIFIVMSTPPLHKLSTNLTEADNARAFANWLKSPAYLSGHPNIACFDLFNELAHPDDTSSTRNMLKYEYEGSHSGSDSHPNTLANQTVGPVFSQFFIDVTIGLEEKSAVARNHSFIQCYPNPFTISTVIKYTVHGTGTVSLEIYDLSGRAIKTLVNRQQTEGTYSTHFSASNLIPGIYFIKLTAGNTKQIEKIVLIK